MERPKSMWVIGLALLLVLVVFATVTYYRGKQENLVQTVETMKTELAKKETEVLKWKTEAQILGKRMAELNEKIKAARSKLDNVKPPQNAQETKERLEQLGLYPEVKCE